MYSRRTLTINKYGVIIDQSILKEVISVTAELIIEMMMMLVSSYLLSLKTLLANKRLAKEKSCEIDVLKMLKHI